MAESTLRWRHVLTVPVGLGLATWTLVVALAPVPEGLAPGVWNELRWVLDLAIASVAAHLVFTLSVSVLSWMQKPWQPKPQGLGQALLCFDAPPPRFSIAYGLCAILTLAAWAQPEKAFRTDGYLQFPSEGLRLLMLAGLVVGAAWLWGRWLFSIGRLVVRDGVGTWSDRHESLVLEELLLSGDTIVGAKEGVSICVRLPGATSKQEWKPSSRSGERPKAEGYRAAGDAPRGLVGAFFASSAEWPRPVPVFPFFPPVRIGGDIRRWYRLLPLALLIGLVAVSVVSPLSPATRLPLGLIELLTWLAILSTYVWAFASLTSYWMKDVPLRPAGLVDGVWLWRLLSPKPTRAVRLSRMALGLHLAASASRRVVVAVLFLALWALTLLSVAVVILLISLSFSSLGWFAPLLLIPAALQWITMKSYRLPVRIKNGLLSIQRAGAWLPVTRVDAENEAIVLSAGPVRVRAQELVTFGKPRDPAVTASLIWPFCAPASAFLSSTSTTPDGAEQRSG